MTPENETTENALAVITKGEVAPLEVEATEVQEKEVPFSEKYKDAIDYAFGDRLNSELVTIEIASEALEYEFRIMELAQQAKAIQARYKGAIGDLEQYRNRMLALYQKGIRKVSIEKGVWYDTQTGIAINDFVLLAEANQMAQYTLDFTGNEGID